MKLIEISAWNDSGGGFLHRLFDAHPQLDVWPFELLLGGHALRPDLLSPDWFRGRFRWPRLDDVAPDNAAGLFDQISDAELKPVLEAPEEARHRGFPVGVSIAQWRERVEQAWSGTGGSKQADFLRIYIESFFALYAPSEAPRRAVLGHCPTIILDAMELWHDFPDAQLVHVVRSPLAGYSDMRRRHPSLGPDDYAQKWVLINTLAATLAAKYPDRVALVALEHLVERRRATMGSLCDWLHIDFDDVLLTPTWQGQPLDTNVMGPFGGVPTIRPGRDAELARALDRDAADRVSSSTLGARQLLKSLSAGSIDL